MFGDDGWDETRTMAQDRRLARWLEEVARARGNLVVVECGAGTAVPSVRIHDEHVARRFGATLIRINPREPQGPSGILSIAGGARETVEAIGRMLNW